MQLKNFKYSELENTPQAWFLDGLQLGKKNLLVGRNAAGKSRTLNVIGSFARGLVGHGKFTTGTYSATFLNGEESYVYQLTVDEANAVESESLYIDGKPFLQRGPGGVGRIWAAKIGGGSHIEFQSPTSELAASARRDSIQHAYLEPLFEWADLLRTYFFGTNLGKDQLALFVPGGPAVDDRNQAAVVGIFRDAKREFGESFTSALTADLGQVGYPADFVELGPIYSVRLDSSAPPGLVSLNVKESDLPGITDQISMSQGMFRVLSLLIYVNHLILKRRATCLLVDDIGEGLDFDRSCRLISLLRKKAETSNLQLILSTNDRFVMNEVPLDEWSFLQRAGNRVQVRNIHNSRAVFEEFKSTGLSNFSFLEFDVIGQNSPDTSPA